MLDAPAATSDGAGAARQTAILVTTAIIAAASGGAAVLAWRALERQHHRSRECPAPPAGHRLSPHTSIAVSQRCWQWLQEADHDAAASGDDCQPSPPLCEHDTASDSMRSSSLQEELSADSSRLPPRVQAATAAAFCSLPAATDARPPSGCDGWDAVLAGVQPPTAAAPLPLLLRGSNSSQALSSTGGTSTGSHPKMPPAPAEPLSTVAETLVSHHDPAFGLTASSAYGGGDSGSGSGSSLTVRLEELQVVKAADNQPVLLGRGNFGKVFKALYRNEYVAVKVFPLNTHAKGGENFRKEIAILRSVRHENIVGFKAACFDAPNHLLMVMELAEGGDLRTALNQDTAGTLQWYQKQRGPDGKPQVGRAKEIALGVTRGLEFLHAQHIVHLDLKSPNVLLAAGAAKVSDVGLARFMPNDYLSTQAAIGTFAWSAPEVLMGAKCSAKVDIYSLGVILWELITGEVPHRGCMRSLGVPEECSVGVADLVTSCMDERASSRPTASEVAAMLSGNAASLDAHRVRRFQVDAPDEQEPGAVSDADRQRLRDLYDAWARAVYGCGEDAAAAGYTGEPLESVVEALRPCDAALYLETVRQLAAALESPDADDPGSAAQARCLQLARLVIPTYVAKVQLSGRLATLSRHLDMEKMTSTGALPSAADIAAACRIEHSAEDPEKWRPTLRALRLSPAQGDALAEAHHALSRRFDELRLERRRLVVRMQELAGSREYDQAVATSAALQANIQAESDSTHRCQAWLVYGLLQPVQYVRAMVAAAPLLVDPLPLGALLTSDCRRRPAASTAEADS